MESSLLQDLINKVVNIFVEENIGKCCLIASIILHELLLKHNIKTKIIQGFTFHTTKNVACRHFWLEFENHKNYDISKDINEKFFKLYHPELVKDFYNPFRNVLEISKDVRRIDSLQETKLIDLGYDLYLEKPFSFWKEALKCNKILIYIRMKIIGEDFHFFKNIKSISKKDSIRKKVNVDIKYEKNKKNNKIT